MYTSVLVFLPKDFAPTKEHLMGGARNKHKVILEALALHHGFGLTVQLHQILCISKRRQRFYKQCPFHYSDGAICTRFHCLWRFSKDAAKAFVSVFMFGISIQCVCVMLMQRSRCQSLITAQPFGLSLLLLITSSLWLPQLKPAKWTHTESAMTRLHAMDKNEPQNLPVTLIDQNDMLFLHCCPQATSQEQSASTGGPSAVSNRRVQQRRDMKPWRAATV